MKREFDENTESPELSALSGALAKVKPEEKLEIDETKIRKVKVFCVPLGDLINALAWTRVDFLSLDAEGSDLDILKTFPWQSVDVKVIFIIYFLRLFVYLVLLFVILFYVLYISCPFIYFILLFSCFIFYLITLLFYFHSLLSLFYLGIFLFY